MVVNVEANSEPKSCSTVSRSARSTRYGNIVGSPNDSGLLPAASAPLAARTRDSTPAFVGSKYSCAKLTRAERPDAELRLPWRAIEDEAVDLRARVLEVDEAGVLEHRARVGGTLLETHLVIAGDEHLRAMRERAEEIDRASELFEVAVLKRIARVNEDVAVRDFQCFVLQMRIGEGDDAHPLSMVA